MEIFTFDAVMDRIKDRHDLKSDYAVGKLIGASTQLISNYRNGRSHPDERMCAKLAEAAGLDPLVLAASMQAQRSKSEEARTMWAAIAERLQLSAAHALAAVFAVLVAMGLGATDARAASADGVHASAEGGTQLVIHRIYSVLALEGLLIAAIAWLLARFDGGFTPCFVPAE